MFQGTKLYSIFTGSCPKCHKGKLFLNSNPYKPQNWDKMNAKCEHCGLKYELEPGFYQGAMYVSYALGVALSVIIFLTFFLVIGFDPLWFFIVNTLALVVFAPFLFRFARAICLNIFVHYDKNSSQNQQVEIKQN